MISCKEASRLASSALEKPLSWLEWLKLKFHGGMCSWCRSHGRDLSTLRQALRCDPLETAPTVKLSPEARERILALVREQLDADSKGESSP